MSADSLLVFYGAQVALSDEEIAACEQRSHPLMKAAREVRLDTYWADFIPHDMNGYELLIGRRFGAFGLENSLEALIERGSVVRTMDEVDAFLVKTGLPSPGKLIVRFQQNL